jgi:putative transcriptional regulator
MTITHHPDIATLMSCAAGSQHEACAAVIASHLSVCPECAKEVARMQEIGVALFDQLPPATLINTDAPVVAARAGEADTETRSRCGALGGEVPAPLQPRLGDCLASIPWRRIAPSIWQYRIPLSNAKCGDLQLIKAAPGTYFPEHGHRGSELTLVLAGSYHDETGTYGVGDLADHDQSVVHQPVADAKTGCVCLFATERANAYTNFFIRLLQPLLRY